MLPAEEVSRVDRPETSGRTLPPPIFPGNENRHCTFTQLCEADRCEATQLIAIYAAIMMAALISSDGHSAPDAVTPGRVPAWKKLGLKLKFANEHTDQPTQPDDSSPANRKRLRDEDSRQFPDAKAIEHVLRKQPRLDSAKPQPTKSNVTDVKVLFPSLKRDSNGIRKSVSFTSDTKVEDGDSAKSLIADWEAQYDQPFLSANLSQHAEPSKKVHQEKVPKLRKSKASPAPKKPHAALEYLTQFCQSKQTWKFNKNKEIWLLKHLFSIGDIPSNYDTSLSQYLQGLRSATTRSRIQQEAEEIVQVDREQQVEYTLLIDSEDGANKIKEVPAEMEDPERRRVYFEDSIRRYKRKLEHHHDEVVEEELSWISPERLAKRRRAEITLWAIGATPSSEEATQTNDATLSEERASRDGSSARVNGVQKDNPPKKRKNRTSVIELSSSSEDESNNSSSDSDSDDEHGGGTRNSNNFSSNTHTTTSTQSSASSQTQEESSSDEGTESSSSSGESSDRESTPDNKGAAISRRRATSIISISS